MNHTCLREFLLAVFFFFFFSFFSSPRSRRPVLYLSTIFFTYISTSCRERTCKKTEPTKENFTRPILPLSTFCVLHQFNVEKKRGNETEREENGTGCIFEGFNLIYDSCFSLFSDKLKTYEDEVLLLTEFELNFIRNSKQKKKKEREREMAKSSDNTW